MLKKICPNCQKPSYSADDIYTWICPYCGKDITEARASPIADEAKNKLLAKVREAFMRYVRMNFINALNYALRNNCKLRIIKECFKTNNPRDYEFLTPHEVLYKLSNSDEEDIIALINGIWEVDGLYYHKGRMVTEQELRGDDNS